MSEPILLADRLLRESEAKALLDALRRAKDRAVTRGDMRGAATDFFLVSLLYQTGLRVSDKSALAGSIPGRRLHKNTQWERR